METNGDMFLSPEASNSNPKSNYDGGESSRLTICHRQHVRKCLSSEVDVNQGTCASRPYLYQHLS